MKSRTVLPLMPVALFLIAASGCGARASQPTVVRPNVPPTICPEAPDRAEPAKTECLWRRNTFMEKGIASAVRVHIVGYTPEKGTSTGAGTGAIIADGRLILTAYHVVKDAEYVVATPRAAQFQKVDEMAFAELPSLPMTVVAFSKEKDVALLALKHGGKLDRPSLNIARGYRAAEGDQLWHFGQKTGGVRGKVAVTSVNTGDKTEGIKVDHLVALVAKSREGDSGGPVLTTDGLLAGIVIMNNEKRGYTYFVPIDDALLVLGVGPDIIK